MTPEARLAGAIDLLDLIFAEARPADASVAAYLRTRRYIGAKDRKAMVDRVYGVLRRYGRLCWHLDQVRLPRHGRALVLAELLLVDGVSAETLGNLFSGQRHGPAALTREEQALLPALMGQPLEPEAMPDAARLECPDWAADPLKRSLGNTLSDELHALREPAALDIRVNTLKADRDGVAAQLAADRITAAPTPFAPHGLRLAGRPNITAHPLFWEGAIEVQEEGSQLVALAVAPQPGDRILDLCSGAGGKTLALGAEMQGRGRLVACDVLAGKLRRGRERAKRAGLSNAEWRLLPGGPDAAAETDAKWLKRQTASFDRVLVDAPCTGVGTWRRNPDSRWRPLGPGLAALATLQRSLLDRGASLVKPGGRLVYATCSLLADENGDQASAFLERHAAFKPLPVAALLGRTELAGPEPWLTLTPARHGTDGFFIAVFERAA